MTDNDVRVPVLKAAAAWVGVGLSKVGIHTWSDFAAVCAAIYSLLLICEWIAKRWRKRKAT